jgi:hypothetical protein
MPTLTPAHKVYRIGEQEGKVDNFERSQLD